jgi:hypothetical protein
MFTKVATRTLCSLIIALIIAAYVTSMTQFVGIGA